MPKKEILQGNIYSGSFILKRKLPRKVGFEKQGGGENEQCILYTARFYCNCTGGRARTIIYLFLVPTLLGLW